MGERCGEKAEEEEEEEEKEEEEAEEEEGGEEEEEEEEEEELKGIEEWVEAVEWKWEESVCGGGRNPLSLCRLRNRSAWIFLQHQERKR